MNVNIEVSQKWEGLSKGGVSFINPYSLSLLLKSDLKNELGRLVFYVDGGLLVKILNFITSENIERISFDYSSIADVFFSEVTCNDKLAVIGSDSDSVEKFMNYIQSRYEILPGNCYFRNGYFKKSELDEIFLKIKDCNYLLCGMGAVKQEEFILAMLDRGWSGTAYSCGGFIHQTALNGGEYYPSLIDKLGLRWAYRIYREKGLVKRYFFDYPKSLLIIYRLYSTKSLNIIFTNQSD